MGFLHDYGMVHRNVKSPNVLLDSNGKAKLSDVNLAHISETMNANTGGGYHTKVAFLFAGSLCVCMMFLIGFREAHHGQECCLESD